MRTRDVAPFALLGDPVAHSRSPAIHDAAFAATGIRARYTARRVRTARLPRLLRALAHAGGGGNVTLPHKELAATALDAPSERVRRTGACNTFWRGPDGVHGENTDVEGFREAARHHGVALRDTRVLLLGAGGAAAAVLAALLEERADAIVLCNRTYGRATDLAARFAHPRSLRLAAEPPDEGFDVVVNATSLGLRAGDPHPLALHRLPDGCAVLDLVYADGGTAWVRALRAAGWPAFDGGEMLLRQAAAAFRCWTGREPPLDVMRNALFQRPGG